MHDIYSIMNEMGWWFADFNKFIIHMSLEIIIQEIKALGYILPGEEGKRPESS